MQNSSRDAIKDLLREWINGYGNVAQGYACWNYNPNLCRQKLHTEFLTFSICAVDDAVTFNIVIVIYARGLMANVGLLIQYLGGLPVSN
jgi:hypothetical protein